jgi:hypothetical protein
MQHDAQNPAAQSGHQASHPKHGGRALLCTLAGRWEKSDIERHSQSIEAGETDIPPSIASALETIDNRATGILTHVSMMIAGLGICAPFLTSHPIEEAVIVFEICVYLLVAVACLRCISSVVSVRAKYGTAAERQHHIRRELLIRHELYSLCNRVSIIFTILVFISLPLLLWWTPQT